METSGHKSGGLSRREIVIGEAIRYAKLGFSVMPLGTITRKESGGKDIKYIGKWKQFQERKATPEEIKAWNLYNLGVVTGPISDLLVLDLDTYKDGYDKTLAQSLGLPPTPTSCTGSGGKQLFFKWPKGLTIKSDVSIGHKGSCIDIRAEGGMVVVPPSTTSYGEYYWEIDPFGTPLADVPAKLLELIAAETGTQVQEVPKQKKKLGDLISLKEGEGRNNAMASLIGKLLNTVPSESWEEEVWPVAQEVNGTYLPPLGAAELESIYRSITNTEKNRRAETVGGRSQEKKPEAFAPAITHAELMATVFPPARFAIEPFFEQGTLNMLSAPPNGWKSWFLFICAGNIVQGVALFGKFNTQATKVMIVNEEDSARLIQDRLRYLGLIDSALPIFYRIANGSLITVAFIDSLIREAKEKEVTVIMFDSLRAIHDADENSSTEMQSVMSLLKKITREGITVLFTHHHRKPSMYNKHNADPDSIRGSSAINAAISGHLLLEETFDEEKTILVVHHLKSKVGPKHAPFEIAISFELDSVDFEYLGEHQEKVRALTETKQKVLDTLQEKQGEWLGRKDFIALGLGAETAVKDATNALEKGGKIDVMTRKRATEIGARFFNSAGKLNEKLYAFHNPDPLEDQFPSSAQP